MRRAIKVRLYPTKEQAEELDFQFGAARWVFNDALELRSSLWKERKASISRSDLIKRLPGLKSAPETAWLKRGDSQAMQQSIMHLDEAFQRFFRKRGRYPRFKSKHGRQAISYPQRVRIVGGSCLYLPKVGDVRAVLHRPVEGEIKTVTVSREPTGKFFASILVEDGREAPVAPEEVSASDAVGIDLGLVHFATLSGNADGRNVKVPNPRHYRNALAALKRQQRALSRKKKGSSNRAKSRLKVARAHERVTNARNDFQHKLSRLLVDENQAICVETLNVRGMLRNRALARSIADAGWSGFVSKLSYKAQESGRHFVKIDRFNPSTKTCSLCGSINDDLSLADRSWTCGNCGAEHDRDGNAADNIRREGLLKLQAAGLSVSGLWRHA